jgi:hypothetical protein
MKSLYNVLQESIFDDEEEILDKVESNVYSKQLIENIIMAKSFKDYEYHITVLKAALDDELQLYCGPDKKPRFKSGGTYIAINPVDTNLIYRNRNGEIHHSNIWIGTAGSPIHYIIDAVENVFGRHDCVETGVSHYNLKVKYANRPSHDSYIYKIDGTKFEGLITYMQSLKPFTINRIK